MAKNICISVKIPGREELSLKVKLDQSGKIISAQLQGIGGPELLDLIDQWRPLLWGALQMVPLPTGTTTGALMLREVLLRAQGLWSPPYSNEKLCYCRSVSTQIVESAIRIGAYTTEKISRLTSAGTACGTCVPDTEELIAYFLNPQAASLTKAS